MHRIRTVILYLHSLVIVLQADFGIRVVVHAVGTKGEAGGGQDRWVTKYIFKYSRDGENFVEYQDSLDETGKVKTIE